MRTSFGILCVVLFWSGCFAQSQYPVSVEVGKPKIYRYNRIAQMMDGMLLDGNAISVAALSLSPSAANGARTDVVQSSGQVAAQYNPVNGIDNNLLSSTAIASSNFQTTLMMQEAQLLNAQTTAQQALIGATNSYNALSATDQADKTNATVQQYFAATSTVANLSTQMANVKGLLASNGTSFTPVGNAPSASTAPTMLLSSVPTPSSTNGPTLPPTKQLDAQIETLWDRLTRIVGLMSQPDNLSADDDLYLVEFDPSILYAPEKKLLLHTEYKVVCTGAKPGASPTVLDVFPRISAININDNKYRDSKVSLSFLASLFSTGASANYNREHLKMTQTLSPSSYVTGYGLGTTAFGWYFAPVIGEDKVSPGVRQTFALIAVPGTCKQSFELQETHLEWTNNLHQEAAQQVALTTWPYDDIADNPVLLELEYSPVVYGQPNASGGTPLTTVLLTFKSRLDQDLNLSANGIFLKRARDNFAHASPVATNNVGLLETATADAMSWTMVGDHTLLVRLDSSQMPQGFPDLLFSTPRYSKNLRNLLGPQSSNLKAVTKVKVLGHPLSCGALDQPACWIDDLPPLGFVYGKPQTLLAARYRDTSDSIYLTVAPSAGPAIVLANGAPTQVVAQSQGNLWSTNASALLYDRDENIFFSMRSCNQGATRLHCIVPPYANHNDRYMMFVGDSGYATGPVYASVELTRCTDSQGRADPCRRPVLWSVETPVEVPSKGSMVGGRWNFTVRFLGIQSNATVTLQNFGSSAPPISGVACATRDRDCGDTDIVAYRFTINAHSYASLADQMTVLVDSEENSIKDKTYFKVGPILSSVSPIILNTSTSAGVTMINGVNFFFDSIQVGSGGTPHRAICTSANGIDSCTYPSNLGKDAGSLFFIAANGTVHRPLRQLSADKATLSGMTYTPPADPKTKKKDTQVNTAPTASLPAKTSSPVGSFSVMNPTTNINLSAIFTPATGGEGSDSKAVLSIPTNNPTVMYGNP